MQVYLDSKIEKHLQALRRSDKKAALAATKAEEIIRRLQGGGILPDKIRRLQGGGILPDKAGNVTKYGEARLKGVIKYDLGSGYRLVAIRHRHKLFLVFVGTHDDCHRWIEKNRKLTVEEIAGRCSLLPALKTEDAPESCDGSRLPQEEEYDPLANVSQSVLREVFCGLTGGNK